MFGWFKKESISNLTSKISREDLRRRSRILIIDDEKPELIEDLKAGHFAVDHVDDINKQNLDVIEAKYYDLILLDFGDVGSDLGKDEGLSILRHIKRVNPAIIVLAYTSKALTVEHSDFFRMSDGTLAKDAGIQESMEHIEEALQKATSIENLWNGLLSVTGVTEGSDEDLELQDLFVRGLSKKSKMGKLKFKINEILQSAEAQKSATILLTKLVEVGVKGVVGA